MAMQQYFKDHNEYIQYLTDFGRIFDNRFNEHIQLQVGEPKYLIIGVEEYNTLCRWVDLQIQQGNLLLAKTIPPAIKEFYYLGIKLKIIQKFKFEGIKFSSEKLE